MTLPWWAFLLELAILSSGARPTEDVIEDVSRQGALSVTTSGHVQGQRKGGPHKRFRNKHSEEDEDEDSEDEDSEYGDSEYEDSEDDDSDEDDEESAQQKKDAAKGAKRGENQPESRAEAAQEQPVLGKLNRPFQNQLRSLHFEFDKHHKLVDENEHHRAEVLKSLDHYKNRSLAVPEAYEHWAGSADHFKDKMFDQHVKLDTMMQRHFKWGGEPVFQGPLRNELDDLDADQIRDHIIDDEDRNDIKAYHMIEDRNRSIIDFPDEGEGESEEDEEGEEGEEEGGGGNRSESEFSDEEEGESESESVHPRQPSKHRKQRESVRAAQRKKHNQWESEDEDDDDWD